jgi:hypothetical protein
MKPITTSNGWTITEVQEQDRPNTYRAERNGEVFGAASLYQLQCWCLTH